MAVQAQVKSGLDLCLRDETTGEWLIGVKDLNIVYLYLANRSNEEQCKTAIAQFHLTSENCTHYNLPDKQQSALERYIGVGGYPTYKIVAPNGNLLPTEAPRPNHPEAIRNMIEKLKDNK